MDDRPVQVVVARPRFSSELAWEAMGPIVEAAGGPRLAIDCCGDRGLLDHLSRHQPDVVVPSTGLVGAAEIEAGRFRLIQQVGVGLDNVDVEAATRKGVWVANMPGLNAAEVAEHALLLLLALLRRLPEAADGFAPGGWGTPPVRSLLGARVCIVGFGAIGVAIATRLLPFGVEVEALTRRPDRHAGDIPGVPVRGLDHLAEAASRADAVILAASQGAGQAPLVDRAVLGGMRRDAILVNVARGGLVDDEALVEALDQGRLAAAGLDVFRGEPVSADHPLVRHPRTLCTAHVAALSYRYFHAAAERLGEAIAAVIADEPPPFAVNSPRG